MRGGGCTVRGGDTRPVLGERSGGGGCRLVAGWWSPTCSGARDLSGSFRSSFRFLRWSRFSSRNIGSACGVMICIALLVNEMAVRFGAWQWAQPCMSGEQVVRRRGTGRSPSTERREASGGRQMASGVCSGVGGGRLFR